MPPRARPALLPDRRIQLRFFIHGCFAWISTEQSRQTTAPDSRQRRAAAGHDGLAS